MGHPIYNSKRWKVVREMALARDGGLCLHCKNEGLVKAAQEVDHILPIKERPDLAYTLSNLQCLCKSHHQIKTRGDLNGAPRICIHGLPEPKCEECHLPP